MAYVRTQIRDRVVTILTGLTTTGNRVYQSRVHPMTEITMPGICVYCPEEKTLEETSDFLTKELSIVIDGYVSGSDFDDDIDKIQAEVEEALYDDYNSATDRFFNGLALGLNYTKSESQYNGDAQIEHGTIKVIYTAFYTITRGEPEVAL